MSSQALFRCQASCRNMHSSLQKLRSRPLHIHRVLPTSISCGSALHKSAPIYSSPKEQTYRILLIPLCHRVYPVIITKYPVFLLSTKKRTSCSILYSPCASWFSVQGRHIQRGCTGFYHYITLLPHVKNFFLLAKDNAFRANGRRCLLQQKCKDEPGDEVCGEQNCNEDDHRANHHFYRVPIGFPHLFIEALGPVGVVVMEPATTGHI